MSLRQLLAVNESVQRKWDSPSPFRVSGERLVPQFPVRPPQGEPVRPAEPRGEAAPQLAYEVANPAEPKTRRAVTPAIPAEPAEWSGRWSSLTANQNRRRHGERTESCLGQVAVVRNDLSASDFEVVVAAKPTGVTQEAGIRPVAGETGWFQRLRQGLARLRRVRSKA